MVEPTPGTPLNRLLIIKRSPLLIGYEFPRPSTPSFSLSDCIWLCFCDGLK